MSLRLWLILFILSMAISAEVLAWAVQHGQFTRVNRGNVMPLQTPGAAAVARRHPWRLGGFFLGLAAVALVCIHGLIVLLKFAP